MLCLCTVLPERASCRQSGVFQTLLAGEKYLDYFMIGWFLGFRLLRWRGKLAGFTKKILAILLVHLSHRPRGTKKMPKI